ncbi:pyridoxal phosphate-dependent aminotransferase [Fundicoccus culcitae]|uniref:Aminotransferase class I/II-fold pyridoxal phosphate-dependent enzyme n=1 Tax=Fundicoccus culcitae TaxID=2969821 RepID=A0ABY5P3Y5_9LACT|nr:aminotransferase class I/II-fold pyridoxal phosphate-dependent enzyme [Fundicoccus culcitae]UUX33168.1 aminotransferase class I/II-fold pyridoxal phosphate-dependent enzyme [Fundicoccus culcitae]
METYELNRNLSHIVASPIRAFNDQISHIEGLIRLTIGEPDFPTPEKIKVAAIDAIQHKNNGYTHSRGLIELRQAVANYLERHYQLSYDPEKEIIITHGATQPLFAAFMTLLNPGDKVITPSPSYVIYATQIALANGELVAVDVSEDNFKLTPERLEATLSEHPETKVLLLNFPTNPTGVTYNRSELEALADVARAHQLYVVSDEIYSELTYEGQHVSMANIYPERTLLINGLVKSHAMTGWRSGFIAGPAGIMNDLFKVHQATINTPNTQMQYASIVGYNDCDDDSRQMRDEYFARRNYLINALEPLGFEVSKPEGAFYLFVKVPDWFDGSDVDFSLALAEEAKVGVIPGSGFGDAGKGYFRLSYAAKMDTLEEAVRRITVFINKYQ